MKYNPYDKISEVIRRKKEFVEQNKRLIEMLKEVNEKTENISEYDVFVKQITPVNIKYNEKLIEQYDKEIKNFFQK